MGFTYLFILFESFVKLEEYNFKDINAEVVLSLYKRIRVNQITSNIAKKYYLSEDESRRAVKRVLNALHQWELVVK